MLKLQLSRVGSSFALAAVLALASPAVQTSSAAVSSKGASARMLAAKLPKGITLFNADCPQTYDALKAAAAEHPDLVLNLLRAAVAARSVKEGKYTCDCAMLAKFVDAAAAAAPERTRELTEDVLSMDPDCAEALDAYLLGLNLPGLTGANGLVGDVGAGGLGAGFGPGFPGAPGFIGSAPGGTIALPPVAVDVSPIGNG